MNLRRIIFILCVIALLGGSFIILLNVLNSEPGTFIILQSTLVFSLPALIVVLLLLLNFKITGLAFQRILIASVIGLGVYSLVTSTVVPFAISLFAFIPLYLIDRQRALKRNNK